MNTEDIEKLIKSIPGAKRAANGLIIEGKDGSILHLFDIIPNKDLDDLTHEEAFYISFCSKKEILRLREIKNNHDSLLRIRAESIVNSARAVRIMGQRKKIFEEKRKIPWSLTNYYHTQDHFHKSYINSIQKKIGNPLRSIPAGLFLSPEVNAMCIRTFTGDVITCSESLQYFYYFMSIGILDHEHEIPLLDRVIALTIAIRIINENESLDFDIDSRADFSIEIERALQNKVNHQMLFTYGHEYSHYLCNHLSNPEILGNKDNKYNTTSNETYDLLKYEHSLEFEADLFAIRSTISKQFNKEITLGSFQVLFFLYFIERIKENIQTKPKIISNTHPTAIERINNLSENLDKKYTPSKLWIESTKNRIHTAVDLVLDFIKIENNKKNMDILSFYGSLYLPSFKKKILKDRIDF